MRLIRRFEIVRDQEGQPKQHGGSGQLHITDTAGSLIWLTNQQDLFELAEALEAAEVFFETHGDQSE